MGDKEYLKRMADLLRSGATMLEDHCPECNAPLFKVREEVWCARCNRRVIKVKEGEEIPATASLSLNDVERTILVKIQETSKLIMEEKDVANLERLSNLLLKWLEVLEKAARIQKV